MVDNCLGELEFKSNSDLAEHIRTEHRNELPLYCDMCHFKTFKENELNQHVRDTHVNIRRSDTPCIYWNHGYCKYYEMCKFSHVEIPACPDQENCYNYRCPLYHFNKSRNNFLGRRQVREASQNQ